MITPQVLGALNDTLLSGLAVGNGLIWNGTHWIPGGGVVENVNVVSASGASQTLPAVTAYTMHKVTLTGNCAFTAPTAIAGGSFSLWLIQDGTGSRVPTWGATFKFAGGAAPTWSTGAGKRDLIAFACVDGAQWDDLGYRLDVR